MSHRCQLSAWDGCISVPVLHPQEKLEGYFWRTKRDHHSLRQVPQIIYLRASHMSPSVLTLLVVRGQFAASSLSINKGESANASMMELHQSAQSTQRQPWHLFHTRAEPRSRDLAMASSLAGNQPFLEACSSMVYSQRKCHFQSLGIRVPHWQGTLYSLRAWKTEERVHGLVTTRSSVMPALHENLWAPQIHHKELWL